MADCKIREQCERVVARCGDVALSAPEGCPPRTRQLWHLSAGDAVVSLRTCCRCVVEAKTEDFLVILRGMDGAYEVRSGKTTVYRDGEVWMMRDVGHCESTPPQPSPLERIGAPVVESISACGRAVHVTTYRDGASPVRATLVFHTAQDAEAFVSVVQRGQSPLERIGAAAVKLEKAKRAHCRPPYSQTLFPLTEHEFIQAWRATDELIGAYLDQEQSNG